MLSLLPALAIAFTTDTLLPRGVVAPRAAVTRMLDFDDSSASKDVSITSVTRSREVGAGRSGKIVVTDGADSLYSSRTVFQQLHDFGSFASIVACSDSTVAAKKVLLSRASRYSGLNDILGFHEGAVDGAFDGADSWLAINPAEAELASQIAAASKAGVSRVFLLITGALLDSSALEAQLTSSGMQYTLMRTGELVDSASVGSGLKLDELDVPACEDVPKEDVFRFVTEALTLDEAHGRAFSLCPSIGLTSTLRQMRACGYERRDEIQVLLKGLLKEELPEGEMPVLSAEEEAEQQELVMRSEAELAAEREEELKMLLARAKAKGQENQVKMAAKAKADAEKREEMRAYYSMDDKEEEKKEGEDEPKPSAGDDDAPPPEIPDAPPADPKA